MGKAMASRLTKDAESSKFESHPAEYLFKDTGETRREATSAAEVVQLMDHYGIETAQIDVNPVRPEESVELFEQFPGRFIGTVMVDPNRGMKSVRSLKRAVEMHPDIRSANAFPCLYMPQVAIDAPQMYPFYAACCELDIPINMLAGIPGPRVPFDCQKVERIDPVCYDFPELKLIMRHGCEPWADLAVKLMLKWPNLYFSTTAFAPKHYPAEIIEFANTRGTSKIMFAGYYPGLSWQRVMAELDELPLREHVWEPFLSGNAKRVFGLD